MEQKHSAVPYRPLGRKLKALRDNANETLAEASGAVEIDVKTLASFELGRTRPSEDVLLLLISHFGARDDEAVNLWELAGYGMERIPAAHMANDELIAQSADDPANRILFTDVADVVVNRYGVVMKFLQGSGPTSEPIVVAKIGMSRDHAKSVLRILQATLSQTETAPTASKKLTFPDDTRKK